MLVECLAIIAIIAAIYFIFLRAGKKDYAMGILPLTFVPIAYAISDIVINNVDKLKGIRLNVQIITIIIALILASIIIGILSYNFKKRTSRTTYLITCGTFTFLLSLMLILYLIKHFLSH